MGTILIFWGSDNPPFRAAAEQLTAVNRKQWHWRLGCSAQVGCTAAWGALQVEEQATEHTMLRRSGGPQADPERILGPLEIRKGIQHRHFEHKPALLAPKMLSRRGSEKNMINRRKTERKMRGFGMLKPSKTMPCAMNS